jgi:catechol 2,3-dioxygenase-like lactoylglutathione lyase family enzyme
MRIDELRETLHRHGGGVEGHAATARVQEVHGRIATARRRRVAGVAGGTVAAVAAIALVVVPGFDSPAPGPGPVGVPTPSAAGLTKHGVTFRAEVLGERLLGAAVGDPGQSTVSFDFVVGEEGLRFSPLCYVPGPHLMVTYSVAGRPAGAVGCDKNLDPDPGAGGVTYEAPPEKVLRGWGLAPGDTATMTLRLVSAEDSQGATVEDPQAVIGGGVYTDDRQTRVVAGAEVPDRVEHDGRVWGLESTYESVRGYQDVHILTGARGVQADTLVGIAFSGLDSPSAWDIRLDGEVVDSGERGRGVDGPSWGQWRTFERGEVYDLRLVVTEGLTDRTRLAFLSYTPVG